MKVARLAEANGLPVTSHGAHDLHVHLLAAVPNATYLEVHGFGLDRFMAHPLKMENGMAIAPDRPGHDCRAAPGNRIAGPRLIGRSLASRLRAEGSKAR